MITWHIGHITRELAEAEPEHERLFSRPAPPRALPTTIDTKKVRATMKRTEPKV